MRYTDIPLSSNKVALFVCGTYWYRSASLGGWDHFSRQGLWWVDALADFLLDEMHGEGKLLPGQLPYLPCVGQSPARKSTAE